MADSKGEPASESEYDVFLNFRGEDTRYNFTDFLYERLVDVGIQVFMDEEEIHHGDVISEKLKHAINNSMLYIPIFSPEYASSKWCLRELKLIVDNENASVGTKSILPIFLLVEPDDLKFKTRPNEGPLYEAAFKEHEKNYPEEVEEWKKALEKVATMKGEVGHKKRRQAGIVKSVVERVLKKLGRKQILATEQIIGIDDRVKDLTRSLDVNGHDVQFIVISGIGGIGKTTFAKEVFNQLSSHFGKRCSFLYDVQKSSSTPQGMLELQKKLLSDILDSKSSVENPNDGLRMIEKRLPTEKVLVVLDDADEKRPVEMLIGRSKLCSGSRIIITSRKKDFLKDGDFEGKILPYDMPLMDDDHAFQLFCCHAFRGEFRSDIFLRLSREIVSRLGGHPLAIKVTGRSLMGKQDGFWKKTLQKLSPHAKILEILMISYEALSKRNREYFLDIACFLVNEKKTDAIYMWDGTSGTDSEADIEDLIEKCLIKIVDKDKLWMHDLLIDLGRHIVCEDSRDNHGNNPEKQSRLWNANDARRIIKNNMVKDKVQALLIDGMDEPIVITYEELKRLPNLRFLKLCNGTFAGNFKGCFSKLKWISWHPPQQHFRANNMHLERLVIFKLDRNVFKDDSKAWDLIKMASNLKVLSISYGSNMTTIPDISKCSSLERLTLENCSSLKRIESFIGNLRSLIELRIVKCKNLIDLPEGIGTLEKLKHFSLWGCSGLSELPGVIGNLTSLTELNLSEMRIMELPYFIEKFKSLRILRFQLDPSISETHNWQFPSGISTLVNLEELDLSGHNEMKGQIPVGIGELSILRILNLKSTGICGIPSTINMLHQLQTLNLSGCHEIQELPELPASLTHLFFHSKSLLSVPNLSNLTNLVDLLLSNDDASGEKSNLFKESEARWIGLLYKLKKLKLDLVKVQAPPELASLSHLEELVGKLELDLVNVHAPSELAYLSQLEQLVLGHLDLERLVQLPSSDWSLKKLSTLEIGHYEVVDIPLKVLPQLKKLTVGHCRQLQRLSIPLELTKIQQVEVLWCPELVEIQVVGLLKSLEILGIFQCDILDRIKGLSYLKNLEILSIIGCHQLTTVEGLNELESLKHLDIWKYPSLRSSINVACTKIPADCVVHILECGQDSISGMLWENLVGPHNTSNEMERPFTINFILKKKQSGGESSVKWTKTMYVTPDSVTYERLRLEVKGIGFLPERMGYNTPGEDGELFIEIKSDEEVKGMVQLASERRLIQLIVEGEVDISLEGAMARGSQWGNAVHLLVLYFCVAVFLLLSLKLGFPRKIGRLAGVRRFGLCEDFVVIFLLLLFLFLGVKINWGKMDPETVAEPILRFLAT